MKRRLLAAMSAVCLGTIGCFASRITVPEAVLEPTDELEQASDDVDALLEEEQTSEIEAVPNVVEQANNQPDIEPTSSLDLLSVEIILQGENASLQQVRFGHAGKEWMVLLGTPSGEENLPVLLALHGSGAMARGLVNTFADVALDDNVILIAPQAQEPDRNWMPGDQDFLNTLVDYVSAEYGADTSRVYVVGSSRGGFTAQGLAASNSSRYAAVASIIAGLPDFPAVASVGGAVAANADLEFPLPQQLDRPVPLLMLNGTIDNTVPYGIVEPTLERWTEWNSCVGVPTTSQFAERTVLDVYDNCADDTRIEVYSFEGGHNAELGSGEFGLSPQLIWDFLSEFSL